ncbi:CesT family type III secretion system chaperone [Acanthopleuribacter pedis]|uniref:Type III secretion system chaperone n=1 Tax=Acanthopleuribacter pedis TaxID=442870 RepID=A0A8J7QBZ2_9BACT|nr:CesT family type III secretion system chaperone [Acanthopleuribacter pedis]MBO1323332.1 type III secretion system chaperone [Acanthopleuribacter pedis]
MAEETSTVNEWLAGLGDLSLDEHGCCGLAAESGREFLLEVDPADGIFRLMTPIVTLPASQRNRFYARVLRINSNQHVLAGAALALDEEHGEISLCHTLMVEDYNADSFAVLLAEFETRAAFIATALHEAQTATTS